MKKDDTLLIRLPKSLKEALRTKCDKECLNMNKYLNKLIVDTMSNAEIATIVIEELEKDEQCHNYTFEKILNSLDISRKDETDAVDLQNIISNFKCLYEK